MTTTTATAPPPTAIPDYTDALNAPPILLNDEQMRTFIARGFLVLKTQAVPRAVHESIYRQFDAALNARGHMGNNALPTVRQLRDVYRDPAVRGALNSVLGGDCIMHQHRFIHTNGPGSDGGGWHKDSYWGYYPRIRTHRPWWAMAMYYPQDTTIDLGPTAVLPFSQHHHTRDNNHELGATGATGEAGTFILIHYDIWHRAFPNRSATRRFMSKFEFFRIAPPQRPAWNCTERRWRDPISLRGASGNDQPHFLHRTMWRFTWDWCAGNPIGFSAASDTGGPTVDSLMKQLTDANPSVRREAADRLGSIGPAAAPAISALAQALSDSDEPASLNATYALASIGAAAIPQLIESLPSSNGRVSLHAAFALASIGSAAVGALIEATHSPSEGARANAAFALGEIASPEMQSIDALARLCRDNSEVVRIRACEALGMRHHINQAGIAALTDAAANAAEGAAVRFTAEMALARVGPAAAAAVPALIRCLRGDNRYVEGHAILALERIGTPEAIAATLDHLNASRWCTFTTVDSPFYP